MATIFFLIILLSGVILSYVLTNNAKQIVTDQALLLIEAMGAVRDYTSTQVNPELADRLETEAQFLPQTVPGYSAREVFEGLRSRKDGQYQDFFYKEATLNPTNLRDKADSSESLIVENFRNNPNIPETFGFRELPGGKIFYIARPISVSNESCLRCHSDPSIAPKSQLTTYGSENGFGWELNEIVGAQIVSVPASRVFATAQRLQVLVMGILGTCILLAMLLINGFLKKAVTTPLKKMSQLAQQVSTGDLDGEFTHPENDEIGVLATSLNRMKVSLEIAMNMLKSEVE
ncbi:MAG: DUF3365 domain-containing protein [Microcystaceae cyanobacterium]